jgi:hypothetical protein
VPDSIAEAAYELALRAIDQVVQVLANHDDHLHVRLRGR